MADEEYLTLRVETAEPDGGSRAPIFAWGSTSFLAATGPAGTARVDASADVAVVIGPGPEPRCADRRLARPGPAQYGDAGGRGYLHVAPARSGRGSGVWTRPRLMLTGHSPSDVGRPASRLDARPLVRCPGATPTRQRLMATRDGLVDCARHDVARSASRGSCSDTPTRRAIGSSFPLVEGVLATRRTGRLGIRHRRRRHLAADGRRDVVGLGLRHRARAAQTGRPGTRARVRRTRWCAGAEPCRRPARPRLGVSANTSVTIARTGYPTAGYRRDPGDAACPTQRRCCSTRSSATATGWWSSSPASSAPGARTRPATRWRRPRMSARCSMPRASPTR